jgi:Uma2 family endonuclease
MVTTQSTHTLADLAELPDDSPIYDIFGGEFVVRNIPDVNHAIARMELADFLFAAYEAGYGYVFSDTTAVALDYPLRGEASEHVSHPDLFFVRQEREHIISNRVIEGVPDLIVEILSPSTRDEHERGGKLWRSYELHGIPHYWIVDNGMRTLAQYSLAGTPYQAGQYGTATLLHIGDTLTSPLFPTLSLPVAKLFRNVRDRRPGRKASAGS